MRDELVVDGVHLVELGVGDVGLGQQHVHVPRHPAGHRVDRVADVDSALLEAVRQLAHVVLCLGDGQAVAGHDHHAARVGEHDGDVVGARRAHLAAGRSGHRRGTTAGAKGAEHDVDDRAVHGPAHHLGEQGAGGADQRAGDDQCVVVEHEAGRRRRQAGERVEQRDHDRHVGAADRHHHGHAEQCREGEGDHQHRLALVAVDQVHGQCQHRHEVDGVDQPSGRAASEAVPAGPPAACRRRPCCRRS